MIKLGPLFVALAALAARGVAADVKPVFEFIQPEFQKQVDKITLPYSRENPDKQCISHSMRVNFIKWDSGGEPITDDWCLYLFDDIVCGHITLIKPINKGSKAGDVHEPTLSSVIRKHKCPPDDPMPEFVPAGNSG